MSQDLQDISNLIRNETAEGGNTKERVASAFDIVNTDKLDSGGTTKTGAQLDSKIDSVNNNISKAILPFSDSRNDPNKLSSVKRCLPNIYIGGTKEDGYDYLIRAFYNRSASSQIEIIKVKKSTNEITQIINSWQSSRRIGIQILEGATSNNSGYYLFAIIDWDLLYNINFTSNLNIYFDDSVFSKDLNIINYKEKGPVSLVETPSFPPNIDSQLGILDLGSDPVLVIGTKQYALASLHPSNSEKYRAIPISTGYSSARVIYFNTYTNEFFTTDYNNSAIRNIGNVLIGAFRVVDGVGYRQINLPFRYRIDGKFITDIRAFNLRTGLDFISHRGLWVSGIAPENSLDAYRLSARLGFKYVETDFCPTADDQLVLMHDASINRTMRNASDYSYIDETVNVRDKTLMELRSNYVLASDNMKMRKQIPTLEEYFITCRENDLLPIAEIKEDGTTQAHVFQAYRLGASILGEKKVGFASFNYALLDYARSLSPDIKLWYIGESILGTNNSINGESREKVNNIWFPDYQNKDSYGLTTEIIKEYRNRNMIVGAWVIYNNDFDDALKYGLHQLAVDRIIPNMQHLSGIVYSSDNDWSGFYTNGTKYNGIIILNTGQYVTCQPSRSVYLGGYYIRLTFKGNIRLESNSLFKAINTSESKTVIYQGLVINNNTTLRITALGNNTNIESVEYCFAEL